jgi:hypothetical protein
MSTDLDQREHVRVPFYATVEVIHENRSLPSCRCFDVSEGGTRLGVSLPLDSPLRVRLPVVEKGVHRTLLLEARVVWRKLGSMGVRFVGLPADTRSQLHRFIETQA